MGCRRRIVFSPVVLCYLCMFSFFCFHLQNHAASARMEIWRRPSAGFPFGDPLSTPILDSRRTISLLGKKLSQARVRSTLSGYRPLASQIYASSMKSSKPPQLSPLLSSIVPQMGLSLRSNSAISLVKKAAKGTYERLLVVIQPSPWSAIIPQPPEMSLPSSFLPASRHSQRAFDIGKGILGFTIPCGPCFIVGGPTIPYARSRYILFSKQLEGLRPKCDVSLKACSKSAIWNLSSCVSALIVERRRFREFKPPPESVVPRNQSSSCRGQERMYQPVSPFLSFNSKPGLSKSMIVAMAVSKSKFTIPFVYLSRRNALFGRGLLPKLVLTWIQGLVDFYAVKSQFGVARVLVNSGSWSAMALQLRLYPR